MFVIEDELHAELCGTFATREDALAELKRRSVLAWDAEPNRAPCTSWRTCGRKYEVQEVDETKNPWETLSRTLMLEVSAEYVRLRRWDSERQVVKRLYSADQNHELEIFRRSDGLFGYIGHERIAEDDCTYWTPMETSGLFDSAETAQREARATIDWIVPTIAKCKEEGR